MRLLPILLALAAIPTGSPLRSVVYLEPLEPAAAVELALASVKRHEGFRPLPYRDPCDCRLVVGYGTPARSREPVSEPEAARRARTYLDAALSRYASSEWFRLLPAHRQAVVLELDYQTGPVHDFRRFLAALDEGDIPTAANELERSLWARQSRRRSRTLISRFLRP